jgi:hypothetical protein
MENITDPVKGAGHLDEVERRARSRPQSQTFKSVMRLAMLYSATLACQIRQRDADA